MRRRTWIAGLAVAGAIGWYLFRPELLFVKTKVNEGLPTAAAAQVAPTAGAETAGAAVLFSGTFHSVAHETHGTATVHDLGMVGAWSGSPTSPPPTARTCGSTSWPRPTRPTTRPSPRPGSSSWASSRAPRATRTTRSPPTSISASTGRSRSGAAASASTSPPRRSPPRTDATTFTIRVENISKGEVLSLSNGKTAPFVSAPVLWAIHTGAANPIFTGGQPEAGNGLERLAETGNPESLVKSLSAASGVVSVGADARPIGATSNGPLTPGQAYEFEISARPGQALSLAWMFGQSNDLFYANDRPIALFTSGGEPVRGDMTPQVACGTPGPK